MKKPRKLAPMAVSMRFTAGEAGRLSYMLTREEKRLQDMLDHSHAYGFSPEVRAELEVCLRDIKSMRVKYDAAWERLRRRYAPQSAA